MSDIVIKSENIGKMYTIGHQAENGRYTALRDVLMQNARNLWNKTKDLATGKAIIQGETMEEVWALKDVSFEIRRGEAVGIIGRNGAGKSTLLKVLSRITEPSTGRVTIKGRVASLLEVGTGFHPELSGRENIYLNGTIMGMTRVEIKKKFDEIVAFAEVEKYLDTPVKRYSSGMYVRLAFAVAAHLEPEILVVDEVLAVGDFAFQKKCLGKMGDVAKEGRTVLFVSHNMEAIAQLCTRGVCLDKGTVTFGGNAKDAVEHYLKNTRYERSRDIDLSLYKRREHVFNSPFRIIKLKLLGGNDQLLYKIGEPILFEIAYRCNSIISGLRIGLGINTLMGQRLCTFHSPVDSAILSSGRNQIGLRVDTAQLKPGTYTIDVGARSGKVDYDAIVGIASFEISFVNVENALSDDDNFGLVAVKHSWF